MTCQYDYDDIFRRSLGNGTSAIPDQLRMSVFPNPITEEELTVTMPGTGRCIWARLYDQQGTLLRDKEAVETTTNQLQLSLRQVPPGLYVLRAFDGERVVTTLVSRR